MRDRYTTMRDIATKCRDNLKFIATIRDRQEMTRDNARHDARQSKMTRDKFCKGLAFAKNK
jgi:hypothetical protein